MSDVDDWLTQARQVTAHDAAAPRTLRVEQRMRQLPSPAIAAWRQDAKLIIACGLMSAACAFWISDKLALQSPNTASVTWIASPPAASPFGLLIGS